jgi:hypothetical protein
MGGIRFEPSKVNEAFAAHKQRIAKELGANPGLATLCNSGGVSMAAALEMV